MIPSINYDFSEFRSLINILKSGDIDVGIVNDIKRELNNFFEDSNCKEVIYTTNNDKLFFGICVMPYIKPEQAIQVIESDDKIRIVDYYVEFDSKLFDPAINLTIDEILAILIYEVSAITNNSNPIDKVREAIDVYLMKNNTSLAISDSIHYASILAFGIKDAIRKMYSIFEHSSEERINDEFIAACGLSTELHSAFDNMDNYGFNLGASANNDLIILSWTLRLYRDVKNMRIAAIHTLNEGKCLTACILEKREIENVIRRLNRIDDSALLVESADQYIHEGLKELKRRGIRSFEDDLFEYRMRMRNVEDENDALYLLRNINTRMSVIDNYIATSKLNEKEQKRWFDLYNSYAKIREELSFKKVYRDQPFGIIVQYPDIVPNRY